MLYVYHPVIMNPNYTIPIIPQNLSKNETVVHIADVLNHLSNITESIFDRINERLESNKSRLTEIQNRVDAVNVKINSLKGAKKATQVFSSSKYPSGEVYKEYVSVFSDAPPIELVRHKVKPKNVTSTYEPLDKLQFYHVATSSNNNQERLEGLGDIPKDINCVNDLLLYNSGKNLYKNFVIADALKGPQNIKEEDDVEVSDIGPAPHSISERSTLTKSVSQNYFYTPQIGEVPALDVPLDLPDLPGIADDLHYENEVEPAIAPSATVVQNVIEHIEVLPEILQDVEVPEIEQTKEEPVTNLPPPPDEVLKPTPVQVEPPVEQTKPVIEEVTVDVKQSETKNVTLPQTDARSSLMEAIRNTGGLGKAKLRPVQEAKKEVPANPAGGLMADLHAKLLMRRKGISGTKNQDNLVDATSTLGKLSAMIPPPEPKNDVESTSNDEEDWE